MPSMENDIHESTPGGMKNFVAVCFPQEKSLRQREIHARFSMTTGDDMETPGLLLVDEDEWSGLIL